jgi:hypothetical protein
MKTKKKYTDGKTLVEKLGTDHHAHFHIQVHFPSPPTDLGHKRWGIEALV